MPQTSKVSLGDSCDVISIKIPMKNNLQAAKLKHSKVIFKWFCLISWAQHLKQLGDVNEPTQRSIP